MLTFALSLSIASAVLYLLLNSKAWLRVKRSEKTKDGEKASYFIGLLFSVLFYYALPIWIWRYGLLATIKIFLICIISSSLFFLGFQLMGLQVGGWPDSFFIIQMIQVPVRAVAGGWIAKRDTKLRSSITLKRSIAITPNS